MGEGYYRCENCGSLISHSGDEWKCEFCSKEGVVERPSVFQGYDDEDCFEDDGYCEEGIPDVNQGWVGEHYG